MDDRIYWRIRQPGKSWSNWADGVADHVDEAQVEAMSSVLDENHQLLPWAANGVTVEMSRLMDIDDWTITPENHKTFRKNYLNIRDEVEA